MKPSTESVTLREIFVEFVSHGDNLIFLIPAVLMTLYVMVVEANVYNLMWFLFGWIVFVPQEYFTHVYILHLKVPKTEKLYRQVYRLHYGHHDVPRRHDLMYMPLWLTLPMAGGNMAFFHFISTDGLQWMSAVSGLFTGYLVFEFSHLMCHTPYYPKTKLGKIVRSRHMWHHYHNEKHWYAVSFASLFMDSICNTSGDKSNVDKSADTLYLGVANTHPWLIAAREYYANRSSGDSESSRLWVQQK